ncbi:MAG TPA: helix-turn-helix domain-containing protein, partial [Humisphaera sp.]
MPATKRDERVRVRMLEAAEREFARAGYRAAGLRAICRGAGVTLGMVRYYFGGKAGLYRAVVEAAHRRLEDRAAAAAGGP